MGEIRDAARTRKKIVEAARKEFAARGYAGARIDGIARRAKLTKQLLYHYFPSKAALFDEILEQTIHERESLVISEARPETLFSQRFVAALDESVWLRFLTWEAAEYPEKRRITRQARRQAAIAHQRNAIAAKQRLGVLPKDVKTEMLQLAMYALTTYPLAFAQITRMVTGTHPGEKSFQKDWCAFLDHLGAQLIQAKQAAARPDHPPFRPLGRGGSA
jgi:TetR/AcrR family transcriptional regulator